MCCCWRKSLRWRLCPVLSLSDFILNCMFAFYCAQVNSGRRVTLILVSTLSRVKRVFMSIRACRVSLYTVPRKLRGRESWKSRPFTITRSPTVIVPTRRQQNNLIQAHIIRYHSRFRRSQTTNQQVKKCLCLHSVRRSARHVLISRCSPGPSEMSRSLSNMLEIFVVALVVWVDLSLWPIRLQQEMPSLCIWLSVRQAIVSRDLTYEASTCP